MQKADNKVAVERSCESGRSYNGVKWGNLDKIPFCPYKMLFKLYLKRVWKKFAGASPLAFADLTILFNRIDFQ